MLSKSKIGNRLTSQKIKILSQEINEDGKIHLRVEIPKRRNLPLKNQFHKNGFKINTSNLPFLTEKNLDKTFLQFYTPKEMKNAKSVSKITQKPQSLLREQEYKRVSSNSKLNAVGLDQVRSRLEKPQ